MRRVFFSTITIFLVVTLSSVLQAQSVNIGSGSFSTSVPAGQAGPQKHTGQNVSPKISAAFSQPIQTNDFWSSLIFPFFDNPHSNNLFAHPLNLKAINTGLEIGYTPNWIIAGSDYLYPYSQQMRVGVSGMNVSETLTESYGDWTVTALWDDGSRTMKATFGHGLPFTFFEMEGGDAVINLNSTPAIWYNQDGVLGITLQGRHYGIFAPSGSAWSGSSTLTSSLSGKNYLSVAVLPDATTGTLEIFRKRAYAFVTGSTVSWNYDESDAILTTSFNYQTELKEDVNGNLNETISALYRHQWLNVNEQLTNFSFQSSYGEMKVFTGNSFSTENKFTGVLPALPDLGDYDRNQLLDYVQQAAQNELPTVDTYNSGKQMGRFAQLIHIADQVGATQERDIFLQKLKTRLEDWFTAGGAQEYSYNEEWDILTGYPSAHGAETQINDHHFHSAYAIRSAATVAQFDPDWASQENWGAIVNLLIRDANNWDRTDERFPFLRTHDAYAGHSWAAGHGDFGDGNNQESSSESMNFSIAAILWGSVTDQVEIRDLGIFLYTNELSAIEQYWFDVNDEVFPENFPHDAIGIRWGAKGVHTTWFGNNPEFIHGINFLPMNSGSMYLGHHPDYVIENFEEIKAERNGQPIVWKDVIWEYLALSDPDQALSLYNADSNYQPFDGEPKANTLHWLYNLKKMGQLSPSVQANIPTYSVFVVPDGDTTYVAYNPNSEPTTVEFSNGFSMEVEAKSMKAQNSSMIVSNEHSRDIADGFMLYDNYPNPFNPSTQIGFSIPKSSQVTITVRNVLGQKVATILNEKVSAGNRTVSFDASGLSSGIYFYTIRAGTFRETKKMLLVK